MAESASASHAGGRGGSTMSAVASAVSGTAKAAAAAASGAASGKGGSSGGSSSDDSNKWAPYPDKGSYKQAQKKVTTDAIYATYYVIAGVAFGCLVLWAYNWAKTMYYRRKVGAARAAGQAGSRKTAGGLSRASSAANALISNWAYVKVVPLWMFEKVTVAEWFWSAAYFGISMGLGFWGCYWQGKLDYANPMGYVAFGQIPILIALAGRNNTVSWITGISYEKLNYLHRMAGRVAILTTWLHTLGWFHKGLGRHGPGTEIFLSGMLGSVAALIMWLTSFALVRKVAYEFFLVVHILMCFIFIVASWYHWPRLGWWCWTGLIFWGFDRGIGFLRMIIVNKAWLLPFKSKRDQHSACTVELVDPQVLRVTVPRNLFKWSPGQHALLTMPQVATLRYEQHPFTMANAPDGDNDAVFIVRAQTGFTQRLLARVNDTIDTSLNAYLEGPYGMSHHSELLGHDTLILVAGGTGVTFASSHFLGALKAAREGTCAISSLRMVWNVREAAHVSWIAPMINEALAKGTGNMAIAIDVYVTRTAASQEPGTGAAITPIEDEAQGSGAATPDTLNSSSENVDKISTSSAGGEKDKRESYGLSPAAMQITTFHRGRSPIEMILRTDVERSTTDAAGVAVGVCGPQELVLDTRRAVCKVNTASAILKGQPPVEFHQENFGW